MDTHLTHTIGHEGHDAAVGTNTGDGVCSVATMTLGLGRFMMGWGSVGPDRGLHSHWRKDQFVEGRKELSAHSVPGTVPGTLHRKPPF